MQLTKKDIITNADTIWKQIRWNGKAPVCTCGCDKIYHLKDGRYKCSKCGVTFSDTSNTILHNSKLAKWQWLDAIYMLVTLKHISSRELANEIGVNKTTAWLLLNKVRMYMEMDKIDFSGVCMMDEAHIGGWTNMHLNKKMEYMRNNGFIERGQKHYDKRTIFQASSDKKAHILGMVNAEGKCQILHIHRQIDRDIIKQVVKHYGVARIISDESQIYRGINGVDVEQSNHSKNIYITKGGHSSNACENRFS